jgi:hypothetical protein
VPHAATLKDGFSFFLEETDEPVYTISSTFILLLNNKTSQTILVKVDKQKICS